MAQETVLIYFQVDYTELQSAQEQLAKAGKIDTTGFKAVQDAIDNTASDTKGLIKQFKDVAGASIKMGKTIEDAFGSGIQDALDEAGVSLEEFEQALIEANQPVKTIKKELRDLKETMARMKAEGKDTGKEFEALRQRAGELADAVADANAEIKNAASDTRGFDNIIGSVSALAGGFSAVTGAAALFGDENEDLQRALLKVNAAMAIAQGLQQVQNALQKEGALIKLKDSIATGAQSAAQRVYAVAVGTSTGAMKAFRIALLATGIGAIIALLVLAADAMGVFGDNTEESKNSVEDFNKALEEQNRLLKDNIDQIEFSGKLNAERLKQQGKDALAIALEEGKVREDILKKLEAAELQGAKDRNRNQQKIADIDFKLKQNIGQREENRLLDEKTRLLEIDKVAGENQIRLAEQIQKQKNDITFGNSQTISLSIALERQRIKEQKENAEKLLKQQKENQKKLTEAEFAELDARVKAQLKALDTQEEQLRIHFENEQEILNEAKQKYLAAELAWEALRQERIASMQKSGADAAKKAQDDEDALQAKRIKNAQILISVASQVGDFYSQLASIASQQEQDRINQQKKQLQSLIDAGAITAKQAKIRAAEIETLERVARQRQAQREKQAAIFSALLAVPKAFLEGLTQGGYVLAAVYAALAAAQAAIIIARPLPKFFRGKKDNYEGPGVVGDMGSELVERDGRMYLYTKPTQTYLGAKDKVYTASETRNILHNTNVNTTMAPQKQERFDYDRLAKAIPKDSIVINFEKDYISEAVANGLSRNNYFNKRYQFKK